ncbi:MAG: hypothetical protein U5L10_00405 [Candidatus Moranbacteria bacterium]|nr:hypothetical protein [Candidatus Moranbacteria bacterium]
MKINPANIAIIALLIAGCSFLFAGCSKENGQSGNEGENRNQEQPAEDNQLSKWEENSKQAGLSDLEIGRQVLVMGTKNSDGSIGANQIIIGNNESDFKNISGSLMKDGGENEGQLKNKSEMSEEEKAKFREEKRAEKEASGESVKSGDTARASGEIVDKDESTIILKVEGDGSKLIFYSDETKVLRLETEDEAIK